MKCWDLIVIGTGLAGLTAARTALDRGARVLIVGRGMGSLTLFGNTIDVLGAIPPGGTWMRGSGAGSRPTPITPTPGRAGRGSRRRSSLSVNSFRPPTASSPPA